MSGVCPLGIDEARGKACIQCWADLRGWMMVCGWRTVERNHGDGQPCAHSSIQKRRSCPWRHGEPPARTVGVSARCMSARRQEGNEAGRDGCRVVESPQAPRHPRDDPGQVVDGDYPRQGRQPLGLVPRILARSGDEGDDGQCHPVALSPNFGEQKRVEAVVSQRKVTMCHCRLLRTMRRQPPRCWPERRLGQFARRTGSIGTGVSGVRATLARLGSWDFFSRISKNGLMISIGIGKMVVEFCSAPISVSV